MTESSPLGNENRSAIGSPADPETPENRALDLVRGRLLTKSLEVVGFWTAVALPFLYVPLLVRGIDGGSELVTFFGLLGLNVAALFLGHSHRRE